MFPDMIFVKNADKKKFDFRTKSMDYNPFKKMSISWPLLKLQFFVLTLSVFYLKYSETIFSDIISVKNRNKRKFDSWTKSMD